MDYFAGLDVSVKEAIVDIEFTPHADSAEGLGNPAELSAEFDRPVRPFARRDFMLVAFKPCVQILHCAVETVRIAF
jgi:hypothetical protein